LIGNHNIVFLLYTESTATWAGMHYQLSWE